MKMLWIRKVKLSTRVNDQEQFPRLPVNEDENRDAKKTKPFHHPGRIRYLHTPSTGRMDPTLQQRLLFYDAQLRSLEWSRERAERYKIRQSRFQVDLLFDSPKLMLIVCHHDRCSLPAASSPTERHCWMAAAWSSASTARPIFQPDAGEFIADFSNVERNVLPGFMRLLYGKKIWCFLGNESIYDQQTPRNSTLTDAELWTIAYECEFQCCPMQVSWRTIKPLRPAFRLQTHLHWGGGFGTCHDG